MATSLEHLIQHADLDALVRYVDDTCSSRDWAHLITIRNEARNAVHTGRQLWPIATLANFRLALWAPAEYAARALDDTARTFMPGPVPEIMAVHHSWDDMVTHLEHGHDRGIFAYERALRGDTIASDEPEILDIPIAVQPWEPHYVTATYNVVGIVETFPHLSSASDAGLHRGCVVEPLDDTDTTDAMRHMLNAWTAQSNGTAHVVVVEGDLDAALGGLGFTHHDSSVQSLTHDDAWQLLGWAASTGAAHGKRRGAATGRSDAWWMFAQFAGIGEPWPPHSSELGDIARTCRYYTFTNDKTPTTGWGFHLIVVDPEEGRSLAVSAHDAQ